MADVNAAEISSDDEEDEDYVPNASACSDSDDDDGDDDDNDDDDDDGVMTATKGIKRSHYVAESNDRVDDVEDSAMKKSKIEDLWRDFKADTSVSKPESCIAKDNLIQELRKTDILSSSSTASICESKDVGERSTDRLSNLLKKPASATSILSVDGNSLFGRGGRDNVDNVVDSTSMVNKAKGPSHNAMANLLSKLGGSKDKTSVVSKSKLDWESFKKEKNLTDELNAYKKNSILDKRSFLKDTEVRQYEIERNARLNADKSRK